MEVEDFKGGMDDLLFGKMAEVTAMKDGEDPPVKLRCGRKKGKSYPTTKLVGVKDQVKNLRIAVEEMRKEIANSKIFQGSDLKTVLDLIGQVRDLNVSEFEYSGVRVKFFDKEPKVLSNWEEYSQSSGESPQRVAKPTNQSDKVYQDTLDELRVVDPVLAEEYELAE